MKISIFLNQIFTHGDLNYSYRKGKTDSLESFFGWNEYYFWSKKPKSSSKKEDRPYDPEFVKMILERTESARQGNTVVYDEKLRKELFGNWFSRLNLKGKHFLISKNNKIGKTVWY